MKLLVCSFDFIVVSTRGEIGSFTTRNTLLIGRKVWNVGISI